MSSHRSSTKRDHEVFSQRSLISEKGLKSSLIEDHKFISQYGARGRQVDANELSFHRSQGARLSEKTTTSSSTEDYKVFDHRRPGGPLLLKTTRSLSSFLEENYVAHR